MRWRNEQSPEPLVGQSLGAARGSAQDTLDWKVFAEIYMKERGFYPHERDRMHRELFHWFTQGAHSEMMGRLTPTPNQQIGESPPNDPRQKDKDVSEQHEVSDPATP